MAFSRVRHLSEVKKKNKKKQTTKRNNSIIEMKNFVVKNEHFQIEKCFFVIDRLIIRDIFTYDLIKKEETS